MCLSSKCYLAIRSLISAINENTAQDKLLLSEIQQVRRLLRLRKPGMVFLKFLKEDGQMFVFRIGLPKPGAPDVTTRELNYSIDGGEVVNEVLQGDDLATLQSLADLRAKEGQVVAGDLTDIDEAGNRSPVKTFEIIVEDKFAPPQPGEVGLNYIAEEDDPTPAPVDPEVPPTE